MAEATCSQCGVSKDESEFYIRAIGARRRDCKECCRERARFLHAADGGEANAQRCLAYHRAHREEQRDKWATERVAKLALVESLKRASCVDCRTGFPSECMDFDHVPERGKKVAGISRMVQGTYSMVTLQVELKKCDLVCANCHRIRTARRGWNQWQKKTAELPQKLRETDDNVRRSEQHREPVGARLPYPAGTPAGGRP